VEGEEGEEQEGNDVADADAAARCGMMIHFLAAQIEN